MTTSSMYECHVEIYISIRYPAVPSCMRVCLYKVSNIIQVFYRFTAQPDMSADRKIRRRPNERKKYSEELILQQLFFVK